MFIDSRNDQRHDSQSLKFGNGAIFWLERMYICKDSCQIFSGNVFKDLYISSLQFPHQRKTKQDAKHQRLTNVGPTLLNVQFRRS